MILCYYYIKKKIILSQSIPNFKTILIIRCGALGDTVYATGILDAMKQQYPDCQIDWLTTPNNKDLFTFDRRVSNVLILKHRKIPLLLSPSKLKLWIRSLFKPYDLIINLETGTVFADLNQRLKAAQKRGAPYSHIQATEMPEYRHQYLQQLYKEFIDDAILKSSFPKVYGAPDTKNTFKLPSQYVVLNASNSHLSKAINYRAWPKEHWQTLISYFNKRAIPVVLIGAPNEKDFLSELIGGQNDIIDLAGKTSIPELFSIIKDALITVTTDTGPSHIAGAVDGNAVVLFGPTDRYAGPLPPQSMTLVRVLAAC